jgi:hypothetical protein
MGRNIPAAAHSPAELEARIEAERVGIPFLLYRDGGDRQQIFTPDEPERVTVGRAPTNDLSLDWDSEVSRLHAELERIGEHWTVSDDGLSRNGTHLNGDRVVGRRRLRSGDAIRFSRTVAIFHHRIPLRALVGTAAHQVDCCPVTDTRAYTKAGLPPLTARVSQIATSAHPGDWLEVEVVARMRPGGTTFASRRIGICKRLGDDPETCDQLPVGAQRGRHRAMTHSGVD